MANTPMVNTDEDPKKLQEEQSIIFDSVPAWIFFKGKDNAFIRVNKAFCEGMGKSKEEIEGKSCFDIFPKEEAEAFWKDDKEVIESGRSKKNIVESISTSTGKRWVQTDKIPYRNNQGEIVGVIGFVIDIMDKKLADDKLKVALEETQKINELMVGRELKMVEMKNRIEELEHQLKQL